MTMTLIRVAKHHMNDQRRTNRLHLPSSALAFDCNRERRRTRQ